MRMTFLLMGLMVCQAQAAEEWSIMKSETPPTASTGWDQSPAYETGAVTVQALYDDVNVYLRLKVSGVFPASKLPPTARDDAKILQNAHVSVAISHPDGDKNHLAQWYLTREGAYQDATQGWDGKQYSSPDVTWSSDATVSVQTIEKTWTGVLTLPRKTTTLGPDQIHHAMISLVIPGKPAPALEWHWLRYGAKPAMAAKPTSSPTTSAGLASAETLGSLSTERFSTLLSLLNPRQIKAVLENDASMMPGEHLTFIAADGSEVSVNMHSHDLTQEQQQMMLEAHARAAESAAPAPVYLGISIGEVSEDEMVSFTLSGGIKVNQVVDGSPAEAAGLLAGDIITKCDGTPILKPGELSAKIRQYAPDTQVTLEGVRDGQAWKKTAILKTRP